MTNHTDTSRIADLRFQVSEKMPINHSDLSCLFDRIEALEAEVERLRGVLRGVTPPAHFGESEQSKAWWAKARAALGEKQ